VLLHYVSVGVDELDQDNLKHLLKLQYHDSIPDAVADLGMTLTKVLMTSSSFITATERCLSVYYEYETITAF